MLGTLNTTYPHLSKVFWLLQHRRVEDIPST